VNPLKIYVYGLIVGFLLFRCDQQASSQAGSKEPGLYEKEEFKNYWYAGKAEVSSYKLDQARYGENRSGKAMLIFVTEDFSATKQVKLDDPNKAGRDKINVLKMNITKNFVTGIYPYSMMLSVFTPTSRNQFPNTLKVTMTSQEWCGHVFSQMNLRSDKYNVESYSYFEQEGDSKLSLGKTILEDELWNRIRLDSENLPEGKFKLIPGLFYTRLKHAELKPLEVTGSLADAGDHMKYIITYPDRKLSIFYQKKFPHQIIGWEEEFEEWGKPAFTKATLDKTLYIDYWKKNKNENQSLRDSLGLSTTNY
jgi:hypothetical protein